MLARLSRRFISTAAVAWDSEADTQSDSRAVEGNLAAVGDILVEDILEDIEVDNIEEPAEEDTRRRDYIHPASECTVDTASAFRAVADTDTGRAEPERRRTGSGKELLRTD